MKAFRWTLSILLSMVLLTLLVFGSHAVVVSSFISDRDFIKNVLDDDASVVADVIIEEELSVQRNNVVGIYLDDRIAPEGDQSLSSGTRTRFQVRFSIWCWHFGIGPDRRPVMEQRDDLLGNVEIALMNNRSLNSTVETSWIEGGEFMSGPDPDSNQFMAGAQIILVADVTAST